jgi:hypothetical protein
MIPTSLLGGVLTGILDATVIVLLVLLGIYFIGRRRRAAPVVHPVADDLPQRARRTTRGTGHGGVDPGSRPAPHPGGHPTRHHCDAITGSGVPSAGSCGLRSEAVEAPEIVIHVQHVHARKAGPGGVAA